MKDKVYYMIFIIIIGYYTIFNTYPRPPVENLEIPSYVSIDVQKKETKPTYPIGIAAYIFEDNKIKYTYKEGIGKNVMDARQKRQLIENKEYVVGQEKAYVINERVAKEGIKPFIDSFFINNLTNDDAVVVICKDKASDVLKYEMNRYEEITDYLEDIIKTIDIMNFYNNKNSLLDVYTTLDSNIRTLILPYVEIKENGLKITGISVFKNGKMNRKIALEESTILNMLNENSGKGIVTLIEDESKKSESKYVDMYGKPKRKIKCWKENDKLNFLIEIYFKGEVITNSLNRDSDSKNSAKKEIEHMMEMKIEDLSNKFITKMQSEYKIDCINLARTAAAKYGKDSVEDWDKAICNSRIYVKAKVNITKQGRGGY